MLRAFSTAATGMTAQQTMVDLVANNLANINTTGFKRSQIDFQDLVYIKSREVGTEVASGVISPSGIEIGSGVRVASTMKVFTTGELQNTGRNLDIAISGDGFLQVTLPNGDTRYTRDGALQTNAQGQLVTTAGYTIEPAITIPTNAVSIDIGKDGCVNASDGAGTTSIVGTIQLSRFANPSGLSSEGDNLLAETQASGTAVTGTAGENGFGSIQSGFLEKANVQMVNELVNLITAQRAYEINSRAIKAGDDMLRTANEIAR
ncbi:MAG: flagellar basal-body rod protein FlgG [Planctomycetes bacterium]|nr:flagellar basal-body rod protein FlgG [Planctomycetota bacterium]MCK5473274.1 flagellar basal-body rod protein FlgG [Planctomycetota bacterium]